jgi:16S rRNA (adenine1518-N6/adenine1519-N6)-dimethyltransferase
MLRQSLKTLGVDPLALLSAVSIDPTQRAEMVAVDGFVAMANALARMTGTPRPQRSF